MTKYSPLTILCTILLYTATAFAQSPAGKINLSAGIGLVPTYIEATEANTPALSLQVGYRLSELFSLNAYGGYTEVISKPKVLSEGIESKIQNKTTMFGLKGQVHKSITKNFDIFGGLLIGYTMSNTTEFDNNTGAIVKRIEGEPTPFDPDAPKGELLYSGSIGFNYHIGKVIGIYSELGYGISLVTLGLNFQI